MIVFLDVCVVVTSRDLSRSSTNNTEKKFQCYDDQPEDGSRTDFRNVM